MDNLDIAFAIVKGVALGYLVFDWMGKRITIKSQIIMMESKDRYIDLLEKRNRGST